LAEINTAEKFAKCLDRNDFEGAREFLDEGCQYHDAEGTREGADEILKMYEANYKKGAAVLDEIRFESKVEETSPQTACVHYFDYIRKGELQHRYKCDQALELKDGKIVRITHLELPGEKELLKEFYTRVGIN
jgi:hypothetical protein